jgi:ParB-like chromosome segregation protein Spo0J
MDFHPIANIFPMMGQAELVELAEDIKARGLLESIEVYSDLIIDGRNRYKACKIVGVAPHFMPLGAPNDEEALAYIISKNLKRRHLDESQRAMVAARVANLQHGGDRKPDQAANLPLEPMPPPVTQAAAAEMVNVSERSVRSAKKVIEQGEPEVAMAVDKGELSIAAAELIAERPPEQQREILETPKPARKKKVRLLREEKKQQQSTQRTSARHEEVWPAADSIQVPDLCSSWDELAVVGAIDNVFQAAFNAPDAPALPTPPATERIITALKGWLALLVPSESPKAKAWR